MKVFFAATGSILGFLLVIFGLGWLGTSNNLAMQSFFSPKFEQVRRNTFEQSRAFNEGMAQELQRMYLDYTTSTNQDEKAAIKSLVAHRVAGYDIGNIENPQLRSFVQQMMRGSN